MSNWADTKRTAQSPFRDELQQPLTEHEALGQAIFALARTPNVYLSGDYSNISEFLTVLGEAYENGKAKETQEMLEEENLRKESYEDERRRWIIGGFSSVPIDLLTRLQKSERSPAVHALVFSVISLSIVLLFWANVQLLSVEVQNSLNLGVMYHLWWA